MASRANHDPGEAIARGDGDAASPLRPQLNRWIYQGPVDERVYRHCFECGGRTMQRAFSRYSRTRHRALKAAARQGAVETNKAAGEAYATFASGAVEFHRQWIEMIRVNTNATLDFVHQVLGVKSPSAFVGHAARSAA